MIKIVLDANLLRQKYIEEKKVIKQVAEEMGVCTTTVFINLRNLGIVRSHRESNILHWRGKVIEVDEGIVLKMYTEDLMSMNEIAAKLGVSLTLVHKIINRVHLGRPLAIANKMRWEDKKLQIDNELMKEMYLEKGMSSDTIAEKLGVCQQSIQVRLKEMGIGRNYSEARSVLWQNPEYIAMMYAAWNKKPNKKEEHVDNILQEKYPGAFAYNGSYDLKVTIGGKIPDWIHTKGQPKLIEFNGCFYHACVGCGYNVNICGKSAESIRDKDKKRLELFKELGFETLVIWEHDSDERVIEMVGQFLGEQNMQKGGSFTCLINGLTKTSPFTEQSVSNKVPNSGKPKPLVWHGNPEPSREMILSGVCRDYGEPTPLG